MQKRHSDRQSYFEDSACTAREFYLPYAEKFHHIGTGVNVLEVGCGEGGNLLPFAERGCEVTGLDLSPTRIEQATQFFAQTGYPARFIHADFLKMPIPSKNERYDVILIHDVIERTESFFGDFLPGKCLSAGINRYARAACVPICRSSICYLTRCIKVFCTFAEKAANVARNCWTSNGRAWPSNGSSNCLQRADVPSRTGVCGWSIRTTSESSTWNRES